MCEFIVHMCTRCLSYCLFYLPWLTHHDGAHKHVTLGDTYLHNPKPKYARGTQKQVVPPKCLDFVVTAQMS